MVLGTLCRLIIPFLAMPSINGMHPLREPVSSRVGVTTIRSADGGASLCHSANLFLSGRTAAPIRSPVRRPRSGHFVACPMHRPEPGSR